MGSIRLKVQPRKSKEYVKNGARFKVRSSQPRNEIEYEKGLAWVKDKTKQIEDNCTKKALQRFSDEYLKECRKLSPTEIAQWLEDFRIFYGEFLKSEKEKAE